MLKSIPLALAALAMGTSAMVPVAADAQRYGRHERAYDNAYDDGYNGGGYRDYDRRGYDRRGYDDRGYGRGRVYRDDRGYSRGQRCRGQGDTGTLVGAIAGGLLGRTIDRRGDRTVGTLGGAVLGGLAGRSIDRADRPGYCR